jgi:hypothetical protein
MPLILNKNSGLEGNVKVASSRICEAFWSAATRRSFVIWIKEKSCEKSQHSKTLRVLKIV